MRRLKAIVTVMVLAVWSACAVHCSLENLTGASEAPCCKDEGGPSGRVPAGAEQCVCSTIQAGGYVSQENTRSTPAPLLSVLPGNSPCDSEDSLTRPGVAEAALSPPEVVRSWQFYFRAALPARAPSLVS